MSKKSTTARLKSLNFVKLRIVLDSVEKGGVFHSLGASRPSFISEVCVSFFAKRANRRLTMLVTAVSSFNALLMLQTAAVALVLRSFEDALVKLTLHENPMKSTDAYMPFDREVSRIFCEYSMAHHGYQSKFGGPGLLKKTLSRLSDRICKA